MELALSLGEKPKPLPFLDKTQNLTTTGKHLGLFCMGLGAPLIINGGSKEEGRREEKTGSSDPPVQLDLLPFSPVQRNQQPPPSQSPSQLTRFPWLTANLLSEPGSSDGARRGLDVNRRPLLGVEEGGEDGAALSSPNSAVSSFQMDFDFSMYRSGRGKRDAEASSNEVDADQRGGCSRASDEEENGLNRKKLRLSKQQSAFLEESFKEHHTLNPKQKLALAKQLNLRPRQVEVWFQNRRARTKLKQTEVDCEYLKRCCETLTEENRRLQKELQELRALKTSQPFYKQFPATTLTMCPSCERVASTTTTMTAAGGTTTTATVATDIAAMTNNTELALAKSRILHPFTTSQAPAQKAGS